MIRISQSSCIIDLNDVTQSNNEAHLISKPHIW